MSLFAAAFDRAFHATMWVADRLVDAWYGVSTAAEWRYGVAEAGQTRFGDPQTNMPSYSLRLLALRRYLAPCVGDVLVDLGCGSGRVLFLFAAAGIVSRGVEFDERALWLARANAKHYRGGGTVEIVEADAANYRFSDETIVYLFNPFGDVTLRSVLLNLRTSLAANPRRVRIAYYHPVHRAVLDAAPWLRRGGTVRGFKTDILIYETL